MPSLSNSPWILGAPHNGLARLISRISRRISNDTVVSAAAASRLPAAIRSEARAVPSYKRVRLNDRKRTTGLREQPIKANENQSVNEVERKLAKRPSPKHIDLSPQYQNRGLKRSSRPEKIREHPPDQSAQVQHHATASPDSQSTTSRIWFAVGTGTLYASTVLVVNYSRGAEPSPRLQSNQPPRTRTMQTASSRFWVNCDKPACPPHVRFSPNIGHQSGGLRISGSAAKPNRSYL
ncbi:hypothetical protein GGQ85_004399 [Nitrobacter vulgaris]|nr:hypothetical protein [Nitrobacter vulgaris]